MLLCLMNLSWDKLSMLVHEYAIHKYKVGNIQNHALLTIGKSNLEMDVFWENPESLASSTSLSWHILLQHA